MCSCLMTLEVSLIDIAISLWTRAMIALARAESGWRETRDLAASSALL